MKAWTTHRWTPRSIAWLGGLFIAATFVLAAFDIVRSYRAAVADTGRELDAQARVIAEQTARGVQAVDVVLRHLAEQLQSGRLLEADDDQLHAYLKEQAAGLVQIDGLVVFRPDGTVRAVSVLPSTQLLPLNVSKEDAFRRLQGGETGLVIADARISPGNGNWVFPMGRRLVTPDGRFAGAVGAPGRIAYFQDFYRDAYPEQGTRVALVRRDGALLARHPPANQALGKRFALVDQLIAASAPAPTRNKSPLDGVERFGALRLVPDYPLAVIVTRDVDVALAPWRAQAIGTVLRTLGLGAFAAFLLGLAMRQLARIQSARESLEASQERYRLAAAGSDDGMWDWDFTTRMAFESSRARELQGLPPEPQLQPLDALVASLNLHPDDAPRRESGIRAHLDGLTPAYECEYRVRHADGGYRWVRVRALCTRDAAGTPLRMAGSVSDIDARKRAEVARQESEERFAVAVTGSDDGIWDWNYATGQAFGSLRAREIVGMPLGRETQSIDSWFDEMAQQLHPDDLPQRNAAITAHLAGDTPAYEGEFRVRTADGGYRWIRARGMCVRDADGRPLRMAGSVSDIDARKRAEEALQQSKEALRSSEERYQLAVDGSNEGLWDWDLASDMLFLSPRAQRLTYQVLGDPLRPRKEWIARTTYHPDDRVMVRRAIAEHLRGATPHFAVEYRVQHHSGEWHWYRQRGVALRDAAGRPYRMAGSMEDISARKNAESQRDRLEQQLRQAQKLEAIGTLAGGIAHDFNNILSAILGYGELAQKDAPAGSALRRHVDAALAAGLRAKSLVERILAFSRSGMGDRVPVPVQAVVTEELDAVAASLPPGVRLTRTLAADDAGVLGDPTQIHQVVMNLCANAVQAMKAEGELGVSVDVVTLDAPLTVATSSLPPGLYVRLAVRDTGHGIPAVLLERIFDPFFTTKEVGVGTGLGLSLVHGIVTDLGGGIAVDSRPGTGSCFTAYLPWQRYVAVRPAAAEPAVAAGQGQVILLVDDEEALVRLGEELLARLGYEPVGFSSSSAALAAFRADPQRFDALLSDEAMPGMTGSELVAEVRRIRPALPVVLMSGFVSPALAARAQENGVSEVLCKPLASHDIARSLAAALSDGLHRKTG